MNVIKYVEKGYAHARMIAILFGSHEHKSQKDTDYKFKEDVEKLHGIMEMVRTALSKQLKCKPNEITAETLDRYNVEITITEKKSDLIFGGQP